MGRGMRWTAAVACALGIAVAGCSMNGMSGDKMMEKKSDAMMEKKGDAPMEKK